MSLVVVLGAGESGVGAARLARKEGLEVFVSDAGKIADRYKKVLLNNEIPFEENGHSEGRLTKADVVVKSPGIPDRVPIVQLLQDQGKEVISEIEFAGRYAKSKFIGVTGSNGKTTTVTLLYHILQSAGLSVGLAGNIGRSLASQLADGYHPDWYVLELSSFQLDGMTDFKCHIAVLLNITPDHLDRYENDLMKYAHSKIRIAQNQNEDDWFIYNEDDEVTMQVIDLISSNPQRIPISLKENNRSPRASANEKQLLINLNNDLFIMTIQQLALQGKHNLYNSMAAGIAARIMEVRKDVIRECLTDFQNIEHRLELVNTVYGMNFINDSKATNVNSTWYALESLQEPVIWIAGGVDKGNDYAQLVDLVKGKVKALVLIGKDNAKLRAAFEGHVEIIAETDNMRDAVYAAYKQGEKGDNILLSPACASFDLFDDYEDRGRQFKDAVKNL